MNNTQHTSGPWNFKTQGFKISIGNADTGATKRGHDYTVAEINDNSIQAEANARLIAAAPELLETLRDIIREAHEAPTELLEAAMGVIIIKAKAAINKATK